MVHGCLFGNVFGHDFPLLVLLPLEGNVWGQKVLHAVEKVQICQGLGEGWAHSCCDPFLRAGRGRGMH